VIFVLVARVIEEFLSNLLGIVFTSFNCESVTYLLSVLSFISAVVVSAQSVTSQLLSYVILVFVAQVIEEFLFNLLGIVPISDNSASVTYLLSVLSPMSAVVASAQEVISHLLSYVIFVFVAQVISEFLLTLLEIVLISDN
jgi:hypothetical protein